MDKWSCSAKVDISRLLFDCFSNVSPTTYCMCAYLFASVAKENERELRPAGRCDCRKKSSVRIAKTEVLRLVVSNTKIQVQRLQVQQRKAWTQSANHETGISLQILPLTANWTTSTWTTSATNMNGICLHT